MSVKVLEKEFVSLRNEFEGIQTKIDDLIEKYEKSITESKKFQCDEFEKCFGEKRKLEEHVT